MTPNYSADHVPIVKAHLQALLPALAVELLRKGKDELVAVVLEVDCLDRPMRVLGSGRICMVRRADAEVLPEPWPEVLALYAVEDSAGRWPYVVLLSEPRLVGMCRVMLVHGAGDGTSSAQEPHRAALTSQSAAAERPAALIDPEVADVES